MSGRDYSVILGKDEATGEPKPIEVSEGALKVAAEVTAPDGGALALEDGNLATLAGTVGAGLPTTDDPAVAVALKDGAEVTVLPGQTFGSRAAAEGASEDLPATYVVGAVDQGVAHPTERWGVSDQTTQVNTAQTRDAVEDLRSDLADHATDATLGTRASEATASAIEDAVDDLEADADASRIAEQSIDAKTLAPLGTDFAAPARGTATVTAAQLPSASTPRGFTLENIDTSADLWVGTDNTVTTANGFRISPSRARFFDLGNPNTLWVISASTTAWQIGAVT